MNGIVPTHCYGACFATCGFQLSRYMAARLNPSLEPSTCKLEQHYGKIRFLYFTHILTSTPSSIHSSTIILSPSPFACLLAYLTTLPRATCTVPALAPDYNKPLPPTSSQTPSLIPSLFPIVSQALFQRVSCFISYLLVTSTI